MIRKLSFFLLCLIMQMPLSVYGATKSTFEKNLDAYNWCWFCSPFRTFMSTANDVATSICDKLQPVFLAILGLFFLFWLVIRVGRMVVDISPAPDTQLVPDVFKQTLRVIVASLLLVWWNEAFEYIVNPSLEMAIGVSNQISLNDMAGKKYDADRLAYDQFSYESDTSLCPDYDAVKDKETDEDSKKEVFAEKTREAFVCYVQIVNASMTAGMAIGATAISGWASAGPIDKFEHLDLLFIGVMIFLAFFLFMLDFPVKLFDPLLTLTFVAALFPLWVVLWAFQGVKKYYEKARDLFIGVIVHLIVISLVTLMAIQVMNSALGDEETRTRLTSRLLSGEDTYKVFTTTQGFGLSGKAVFLTIALWWLSSKIIAKAAPIAGQFENVVDFGASKGASALVSQGTSIVADGGKHVVSGSYHLARGTWRRAATRDDAVGKVARGAGTVAMGALAGVATAAFAPASLAVLAAAGAATATRRFMPVPKNRPHDASWSDRANIERSEDLENDWMLNRKKGVSSSRNKQTKEWEKYNSNSQIYQEFDSAGRIQNEYDRNRGSMSLADKKYKFSVNASDGSLTIEFDDQKYSIDLHGNVRNEKTHLAVDSKIADQVRDIAEFQRHAEQRIAAHEGMLRSRPGA